MSPLMTRLRALLQRRRVARELDDELRFHVEMETRAHIARGMSPSDARRRALADFGGVVQAKEAVRDVRTLSIGRSPSLAMLTVTTGGPLGWAAALGVTSNETKAI